MKTRSRILLGLLILALLPGLALAQDRVVAQDRVEAPAAWEKPAFGFDLDLAYEYRYAPGGEVLVEDWAVKSGIDLQRNYFDRSPFARIAIGSGYPQGLSIAIETSFRPLWEGDWYKADNLPGTGKNPSPFSLEAFFITRGVAYWRSPGIALAFGRDKVDYGGILYGSLLPSTRLPYLDSLRARASLGNFTIDWMVATIQALKSWDNVDVDPDAGLAQGSNYYGWEGSVNPTVIVEGLNRFSWRIGNLSLAISDHVMMARRNNFFYLTDFFPIMARHQSAVEQTNNSLIADLAWSPLPGLDLAAQGGLDDVNLNDVGYTDTGTPTIPAYVLGGRYHGSLGAVDLRVSCELGYTHWLWGNYDATQIDVQVGSIGTLLRFQARYLAGTGALLLPLTSPYGPGSFWVKAGGSASFRDSPLVLGLDFLYLAKNSEANLIDTPVFSNTTTASAPIVHFASLALPVSVTLGDWLVSLSPAVLVREGDWRFEATALASYKLRTGSTDLAEAQAWAGPAQN